MGASRYQLHKLSDVARQCQVIQVMTSAFLQRRSDAPWLERPAANPEGNDGGATSAPCFSAVADDHDMPLEATPGGSRPCAGPAPSSPLLSTLTICWTMTMFSFLTE